MTHIEQMIQDMCPNGVEFKTLGEVTYWDKRFNEVDRSLQPQIRKYHYYLANELEELESPTGTIKILYTSNRIAYADEETVAENVVDAEVVAIPWGGNANIKYFKGKFITADNRIAVVRDPSILSTKFVYYWLTKNQAEIDSYYRGAGIKHPSMLKVLSLPIPLPPIEIQKKIVECLDKFSALAAELQAELQMRRKQYEYYRTQLLTPHSDCNSATKSDDAQWEWKTLGEICEINRGVRVVKNELEKEGKYPVYQNSLTPLGYYDKSNYPANTTFVISAGAAGKVGFSDVDFWAADDCLCLTCPDMLMSKFLYYQLMEKQDYFLSQVRHASVPRLSRTVVESFKIPLPSLAEQARIVAILDKFEKLITSMEEGIPAEQIRQQKRYEHFRDLLLTFDRKAE